MHVLVTADTLGGVWIYARELVTGLARRGVRVTLVSFGEIPSPSQTEWMDGLKGLDYRPTGFRLEWMQECEEDLAASADYLKGVVEDVKPDLLHLNQYYYGDLAVDVPRLLVAHSDVYSWWNSVHGELPRETRWHSWYRELVTRGVQNADTVVAPSQWMLEAISCFYVKPESGVVIYNGRTPTLFNPHVSKEDTVLSVGRLWDSGKQVTLLTEREMPVSVYLVGSAEHPDPVFRATLLSHEGRNRIHFKGAQSEAQLRQLYSRTAIYAATSRYEPFGLAPVEAALSRCAIVANDIPTFHELWGDSACYFRHNDSESLAKTITRLHAEPELRQTYANLAYQRALQCFTADRMVDDYMNLYRVLMPAGVQAA